LNGVDNNIDNNILGFRSKLVHKTLKANWTVSNQLVPVRSLDHFLCCKKNKDY
jgi:hypothetical protein